MIFSFSGNSFVHAINIFVRSVSRSEEDVNCKKTEKIHFVLVKWVILDYNL